MIEFSSSISADAGINVGGQVREANGLRRMVAPNDANYIVMTRRFNIYIDDEYVATVRAYNADKAVQMARARFPGRTFVIQ